MQTVLVIFFQMFGSTYRKGGTEIYIQSWEKFQGSMIRLGLVSCTFFCIYNLCILKIDFKALIVMQMLKQKEVTLSRIYIVWQMGTSY